MAEKFHINLLPFSSTCCILGSESCDFSGILRDYGKPRLCPSRFLTDLRFSRQVKRNSPGALQHKAQEQEFWQRHPWSRPEDQFRRRNEISSWVVTAGHRCKRIIPSKVRSVPNKALGRQVFTQLTLFSLSSSLLSRDFCPFVFSMKAKAPFAHRMHDLAKCGGVEGWMTYWFLAIMCASW